MLLGLDWRRLFGWWPRQHQGRGHRVSMWTSTGLKVTAAGCWLLLLFGPKAEGDAGLGLLGSSSRLVLIFLERDTHVCVSLLPRRLNDFDSDKETDVDHH